MSGATLRKACLEGLIFQVERIIAGALDISGMRSPIYTGMQTSDWVTRKALVDIIKDRDAVGNAAIHICCMHNRIDCLEAIIKTGLCDVSLKGQNGFSAAAYCANMGFDKCLALLIGAGFDVTQEPALVLDAALQGHAAVVDLLLLHGAAVNPNPNQPLQTPLHLAVLNSNVDAARALINGGADVNACNGSQQRPQDCCVTDACRMLFESPG